MLPALERRRFAAAMAASFAVTRAWSATPASPAKPSLLVAGPVGGHADRWADVLAPALARAFQQGSALARENVGGPDGVTGANQFEARAVPDGSMALLLPGRAALSWLVGDPRVRFDAAHWIPVWAGMTSAAVASRVPLGPGRRVRYAIGNTVGPDLAGLLALDLLGVEVVPVAAATGSSPPDVDVVFLQGTALHSEAWRAAAPGMSLAFSFGTVNGEAEIVRDPELPEVPTAHEVVAQLRPGASGALLTGLRAMSAAVQLDLALALPQLSPAAAVAWWRRGCAGLAQFSEGTPDPSRLIPHPSAAGAAGGCMNIITAQAPVLIDLRRWLSERWQWHPV